MPQVQSHKEEKVVPVQDDRDSDEVSHALDSESSGKASVKDVVEEQKKEAFLKIDKVNIVERKNTTQETSNQKFVRVKASEFDELTSGKLKFDAISEQRTSGAKDQNQVLSDRSGRNTLPRQSIEEPKVDAIDESENFDDKDGGVPNPTEFSRIPISDSDRMSASLMFSANQGLRRKRTGAQENKDNAKQSKPIIIDSKGGDADSMSKTQKSGGDVLIASGSPLDYIQFNKLMGVRDIDLKGLKLNS